MRATVIHGAGDVRLDDRPDPQIQSLGDAVVRVVRTCVCGSDLWPYRGVQKTTAPHPIGHEFIGVVEAIGAEVSTVRVGDFVIAPFTDSDGTCVHCRNGITTSCVNFGFWGHTSANGQVLDGAQGQYVRVPFADGTLVKVPGTPDVQLYPHLLTLTDVLATGHHAARSGDVREGATVVIVGDGAVGLCAVLASKRLSAARVIVMSRHEDRQRLARTFGATDIVAERGEDGIAAVKDLLGGIGADSVLECVGTKESMRQALGSVRPGGHLGFVGVPAGAPELPMQVLFNKMSGWQAAWQRCAPTSTNCSPTCCPGPSNRPGLRPDPTPRSGVRRLRSDGRAPVDQGTARTLTEPERGDSKPKIDGHEHPPRKGTKPWQKPSETSD